MIRNLVKLRERNEKVWVSAWCKNTPPHSNALSVFNSTENLSDFGFVSLKKVFDATEFGKV
jgi:hypothetical protein